MSAIPGQVDTERGPPLSTPLAHFLVAGVFLAAGVLLGVLSAVGAVGGATHVAHVHLLLAGWVCVTIMGAMTQFVPVWSGVPLHSRRLATLQLPLVAVGIAGFVACLLESALGLLPLFGLLMLAGFWTFAYNVARSLPPLGTLDVTERHFALALCYFVVVTAFGLTLATDLTRPVLAGSAVAHEDLVAAHATLAVFGAVLTTVVGALYQLGTMFTQTDLHGVDHHLRRVEELAYPVGVVSLATGRLLGDPLVARVGGVLVVAGLLAFAVVLGRKLLEARVERTPMLSRYAVVAVALALWALLTLPAWLRDPLASDALLGSPDAMLVLPVGVVGFVVLGTLYHVVPFLVWVHAYSDRLGFEPVPAIDDLYVGRVAAVDFWATLVGTVVVSVGIVADLPIAVVLAGGLLLGAGLQLFAANMVAVLLAHAPGSLGDLVVPGRDPASE